VLVPLDLGNDGWLDPLTPVFKTSKKEELPGF
jgi:hypothetical protein